MLKKFVCLIAAIFAAAVCFPAFAFAETPSYVRITRDGVELYANYAQEKVVCLAQKSYYLKVLSQKEDCFRVELMDNSENFPKITVYVKCAEVEYCSEPPISPLYPKVSAVVSSDSAKIRFSPLQSAETLVTATNTQSMSFYGKIISEEKEWYYVCYEGVFGYVEAKCVYLPRIALHPTPLQTSSQTETETPLPPQENAESSGTSAGEILLIAFAVLLAIGLTVALFAPRNDKKKTGEEYYFDKRF